jgi:hypothetical protein
MEVFLKEISRFRDLSGPNHVPNRVPNPYYKWFLSDFTFTMDEAFHGLILLSTASS